jgi:hypothetical protein
MLFEKGLSPLGLTISGGDSAHWDRRYVTVPKMRLLTGLLSISYRGELQISKRLRDYAEFRRQLQNIGTMATDSGAGETWRARRGHDDLAIAVSMAVWHLENPGPNMEILEFYRRQAGVPLENYCVAVDFGQSVDNCAICVMSRTSAPAPEPGAAQPVESATGGASVDLPAPIQQPESTARPPDLGSPEWQHQVSEGQRALLRRQGFSSGGPLKPMTLNPAVHFRRGGNLRPGLQPQLAGSTRLQACGRDQLSAAQIFSQRLAENAIPALHRVQLLRFFAQLRKELRDAHIGAARCVLLAMGAAHR